MTRRKILIVDNEEDFLRLMRTYLEGNNRYKVRIESKGSNAFAAVRDFRPDIILLDIMMPDMQGDDVAAELANDESTRRIPIIFLTGIATKEEIEAQNSIVGGHTFVAKPVKIAELIDCIEKKIR